MQSQRDLREIRLPRFLPHAALSSFKLKWALLVSIKAEMSFLRFRRRIHRSLYSVTGQRPKP